MPAKWKTKTPVPVDEPVVVEPDPTEEAEKIHIRSRRNWAEDQAYLEETRRNNHELQISSRKDR